MMPSPAAPCRTAAHAHCRRHERPPVPVERVRQRRYEVWRSPLGRGHALGGMRVWTSRPAPTGRRSPPHAKSARPIEPNPADRNAGQATSTCAGLSPPRDQGRPRPRNPSGRTAARVVLHGPASGVLDGRPVQIPGDVLVDSRLPESVKTDHGRAVTAQERGPGCRAHRRAAGPRRRRAARGPVRPGGHGHLHDRHPAVGGGSHRRPAHPPRPRLHRSGARREHPEVSG